MLNTPTNKVRKYIVVDKLVVDDFRRKSQKGNLRNLPQQSAIYQSMAIPKDDKIFQKITPKQLNQNALSSITPI